MPTALITGAGRGLGLEFARQFADDGWTVLAGVREPERADDLRRIDGDVSPVPLDVADPASVAILGERLSGVPIDLLINNAGVYGPRQMVLGEFDYDAWREVFEVNTLAPMRVAEAFIEHIRAGQGRKIVTVSSKMGSIADSSGGSYIYRSSKAGGERRHESPGHGPPAGGLHHRGRASRLGAHRYGRAERLDRRGGEHHRPEASDRWVVALRHRPLLQL